MLLSSNSFKATQYLAPCANPSATVAIQRACDAFLGAQRPLGWATSRTPALVALGHCSGRSAAQQRQAGRPDGDPLVTLRAPLQPPLEAAPAQLPALDLASGPQRPPAQAAAPARANRHAAKAVPRQAPAARGGRLGAHVQARARRGVQAAHQGRRSCLHGAQWRLPQGLLGQHSQHSRRVRAAGTVQEAA